MASGDRWPDHEPSTALAQKAKSNGINPSSFHKNKKSPQDERLRDILDVAAHSVVLQKRKEFTSVKNIQREAYHDVTSLKVFPLQELAIDYLDEMMKEYLGDAIILAPGSGQPVDDVKNTKSCAQGDDPQYPSLDNYKRRRIKQYTDGPGETYTSQFLTEKYHLQDSNDQLQEFKFLPELWSMEPRIFSVEKSSTGKRKYIVGNLGRFLQYYWRDSDPLSRHYYELIREGTHCRLYFDLEFCKKANPEITTDECEVLMTEFNQELCNEFQLIYGIRMDRSCILDLDSSTDKKFSRHLIIHLPNGELFADACSAGVFVKRFVGRLAEELSTGALAARRSTLAKHLFVNRQAPKTIESQSSESGEPSKNRFEDKEVTPFIDLAVYTRNRLFRLMGSMKYGKPASAALRIADANRLCFPTGFDNSKFYLTDQAPSRTTYSNSPVLNESCNKDSLCSEQKQYSMKSQDHNAFCAALDWEAHARALSLTLVVPANATKLNPPILMDPTSSGEEYAKQKTVSSVARRSKSSSRVCNGDSPIPKLDRFISELSNRGIQGKIRAWSIECVNREGKPDSYYMSYQMSDNRWCENIGRPHRSNNIIWNVDLICKTVWQTCHDPDCRASNFRGCTKHLPEEVATDVSEYLLEQELAELDEDKIISSAKKPCFDFGDNQLDEELGDLNMTLFKSRSDVAEG